MPIKPENRAKYPAEWAALRDGILERAGHACELCFLDNHATVYRAPNGRAHTAGEVATMYPTGDRPAWADKPIRIVLTIAHVNQDPGDNRPSNLLALCQRCHLRIDQPYNEQKRAEARHQKRVADERTRAIRLRTLVRDFYELPGSARREICLELGLITQDDIALGEQERYSRAFSKAHADGKVGALLEAVTATKEGRACS